MLESVVKKISPLFTNPEEVIINQGDEGDCMYFNIQGECVIYTKSNTGRRKMLNKLLMSGAHYGEISMIYKGTKRTTSVVSRNYNTIGKVDE